MIGWGSSDVNLVYEGFKEGELSAQKAACWGVFGLNTWGCFIRWIRQEGATHVLNKVISLEERTTKVLSLNFNIRKSLLDERGLVGCQPRAYQQDASGDHLQFSVTGLTFWKVKVLWRWELKWQLTMKTKFERQRSQRAQFAPQSATIFKQWVSLPPLTTCQDFLFFTSLDELPLLQVLCSVPLICSFSLWTFFWYLFSLLVDFFFGDNVSFSLLTSFSSKVLPHSGSPPYVKSYLQKISLVRFSSHRL